MLFAFRIIAILFFIIALARPQSSDTEKKTDTEGVDIMIALDISGSMLARDFKPDRLEAAKDLAIEFISGRPDDRIGLVVYSAESFTQCPLTTDHAVLINFFSDIKSGMLEDGTAIGSGLATAVSRLKDSNAKSKIIILLTDGVNNRGSIPPLTAAEIAKKFSVRVYTVGIGTMGMAPYPVQTPFGIQLQDMPVEIDEAVLSQIAQQTNGKYFRATNNQKLREIYKEIDMLEKTKFQVTEYSRREDEYFWFAVAAGISLLIEIILRFTLFRTLP
jgi:Ca-activated chloride channel family protein